MKLRTKLTLKAYAIMAVTAFLSSVITAGIIRDADGAGMPGPCETPRPSATP